MFKGLFASMVKKGEKKEKQGIEQLSNFELYVFDKIKKAISGIDSTVAEDIYVLSFYIFNNEDAPREPVLEFGYNTETHYKSAISDASDREEAKWNYAFWLQNEEAVIGMDDDQELVEKWIKSLGLYFTEADEEEDFDRVMDLGDQITEHFTSVAVRVSRKLHDQAVITDKFKKPIPVIIHSLEYDEQTIEDTRNGNPDGLVDEFCNCC